MSYILATDLDGTLFYPKRHFAMIGKRNIAFLRRVKESGGRVVLVSSRSEAFLKKVEKKLGFDVDYIGTDGTMVVADKQKIRDCYFDATELRELVSFLRDSYDPPLFLASSETRPLVMTKTKVSHMTNFMYVAYQMVQGVYREPWVRSDHVFFKEIETGKVNKLMVLIGLTKANKMRSMQITAELQRKFPNFEFVWLNQFIEITPKGCSKASGLEFYLDYLGLNHDNVVVVGDSGNDVPMFEAFYKHSFAMKHAPLAVKERASGVVKYVYELEEKLYPSADNNTTEPRKK